ncbi:MAG TPA: hypothetical protein VI389_01665, partial [Geobacteraceae bacterium]
MAIVFAMGFMPASATAAPCPNDSFRVGPSAALPDCRAYELVSPADANGRLLEPVSGFANEPPLDLFPTELASPSRDSIVFETNSGPLPDAPEPAGAFDIYESQRSPGGWQTARRISPSGAQSVSPKGGGASSDHLYSFTHASPLDSGNGGRPAGSLAGKDGGDYLGNPDGSFELVGLGSLATDRLTQGRYISPGGGHVIFSTGHLDGQSGWCKFAFQQGSSHCTSPKLEPNAAPEGTGTIYDREADGPTHVVSLLPGDIPQTGSQQAFYQGASKNGTSIAFKIEENLYVRVNSGEAGEETEEAAPAAATPVYAGLSEEGRYLFYVEGGEKGTIHRFEVGTEADEEINPTAEGEVVNVSADGSHVYFISEEQIGGKGTAGQPNLFVWSSGATQLVATVAASDLVQTSGSGGGNPALTRWTSYAVAPFNGASEKGPGADSSRTTPDGNVIVFESKAKLTSYENAGHTEIYRWDDNAPLAEALTCVSCKGAPEPATGDARLQEFRTVGPAMVIHNLSDDGSRVFFETPEALSGTDTDSVNDVYEWQQEAGIPRVDLISSGHSVEYPLLVEAEFLPLPNLLYSVTPDGSDVVFLSQDELTGDTGVGGVPAIYDARVEGGFPPAPAPPQPCAEEACRRASASAIPSFGVPQSESATGRGNVKPSKRHCRGGKAKKGKPCAKKGSKKRPAAASAASAAATPAVSVASGAKEPSASPTPSAASTPVTAATEFEEFGINSFTAALS